MKLAKFAPLLLVGAAAYYLLKKQKQKTVVQSAAAKSAAKTARPVNFEFKEEALDLTYLFTR